MKTLIICIALLFGGFGTIGSMVAFSTALAAGGAECGRLKAQIAQLQKTYAALKSELGGGFGTTAEWWAKRGNQLMSEMRNIQADLDKKIELHTKMKCPD